MTAKRIAIFGANGQIGGVLVDEALSRGHDVTAAVRSVDKITVSHPRLTVVEANISDARSVAGTVAGHDAVVSAIGGLGHENPRIVIDCAPSLVAGLISAGVLRLIIVGTAGTLLVAPGLERMATADFPAVLLDEATSQKELQAYLAGVETSEIEWTYFAPPGLIEPGVRTGHYRLGGHDLPYNSAGESYISTEDYAVALLDEIEAPRRVGQRFTATSERVARA